jgi:hypothetical protein
METENNDYQSLNVPQPDIKWMACCVNAYIELLELPVKKLNKPEIQSIADTFHLISKNSIPVTSEGFLDILIEEFIDEAYRSKCSVRKLIELCEEKYYHLTETGILD